MQRIAIPRYLFWLENIPSVYIYIYILCLCGGSMRTGLRALAAGKIPVALMRELLHVLDINLEHRPQSIYLFLSLSLSLYIYIYTYLYILCVCSNLRGLCCTLFFDNQSAYLYLCPSHYGDAGGGSSYWTNMCYRRHTPGSKFRCYLTSMVSMKYIPNCFQLGLLNIRLNRVLASFCIITSPAYYQL